MELGKDIEQTHMRNRKMISEWAYELGRRENVIEKVVSDGKTYIVVNDFDKLRTLFGKMLREVQRIKSEGDFRGGTRPEWTAFSTRRSAAPGRRFSTTSSQAFQQVGRNIGVKHGRGRIDDAHVHARPDGVVEEHGMHGLTDIVVAPEEKDRLLMPPADMGARKILQSPAWPG